MIGKQVIESIFDFVFSKHKGLSAQISFHSEHSLLTRFANSSIHQNVHEKNSSISITVFLGKKEGTARTNSIKKIAVASTIERAIAIAKHKRDDPEVQGPSSPRKFRNIDTFFPATARFSHQKKAELLKGIFDRSKPYNCFGAFTTGTAEIAIGNSKGLFAYNTGTDAILRLTIKGKSGSSFGQCAHRDVRKLECEQLLSEVLSRAKKAQCPREAKPGKYTVILTPEAVSHVLIFLGFMGFNALPYSEGRSCLQGKLGKRLFSTKLNIVDDPLDERGFAFPFDFEGIPKKRLTLVEKGVVKSLVHDRKTARRMKQRSTGHHMTSGAGPFPLNMVIQEGSKAADLLRKEIKRGIEISSLHYVNVVEPNSLTLTGMTRNGTFMIKNGAIAYPLKNMRFNQSILSSLKNIKAISSTSRLVEGGNSYGARFSWGFILPYLVIRDFNFTGMTEF